MPAVKKWRRPKSEEPEDTDDVESLCVRGLMSQKNDLLICYCNSKEMCGVKIKKNRS